MNILVIDTSSKLCSIGLRYRNKRINEEDGKYERIYRILDEGKTHSETLLPLIDEVLNKENISLKDINLLGIVIGPRFFYRY